MFSVGAWRSLVLGLCVACPLFAQGNSKAPANGMRTESTSTVSYRKDSNGAQILEIHNSTYEATSSGSPGRPANERLLLLKTVRSHEISDDVDVDSTVTLTAWPVGTDVKQKPLYSFSETGTGGQVIDSDFFVVDRRLGEVAWWSVHKLGNGQRLFDTHSPLVSFSLSRETVNMRYAGLEVPPDDAKDKRLTEPHVVAVITYASADRVMREALLTSDDAKQAQLLRSYADSTRTLSHVALLSVSGRASAESHLLQLSISQNYPSPPGTLEVMVPVAGDDLDVAHAKLPPHLHLAIWKR